MTKMYVPYTSMLSLVMAVDKAMSMVLGINLGNCGGEDGWVHVENIEVKIVDQKMWIA